ncbi:XrtA system polysaccharide deacetylase [Methylovulum miyakonense]|uniref:XrtA system polysaccharide deacetylase n=1 Tax=Methylovulum miyakonense TaxID=645578 RepID=UPI0003747A23|nr:XrtA system polysaccharide deacetylase [Methylovulum miyakonense]
MTIKNAMTVDVEDYFQVSAFEPYIAKAQWDVLPHRVARNTHHILDLFAGYGVNATFFTLGWVAERYPELVRRIIAEGHELACHGYEHIRVTEQTPGQFRADVAKSKQLLEDLSGVAVKGYRAASYSINASNLWALEVLQEEGFGYSSSIYPVKHDIYGMPDAPRFLYAPLAGHLDFKEIPITTLRLGSKNLPCGGGGFFRFYPYPVSKWAFKRVNTLEQQAGIFYFHPWEIDPGQPRQSGLNLKTRTRHYLNLGRMENRIRKLLEDFEWDTMEKVFL